MRKLGWAVTGLVFWAAPLLGGTADRPYTLICAALCALAALFFGLTQTSRLRLSWFHALLLLAIVATLLQVVPLPPAVRAIVAPGSDADLRQLVAGLAPDARTRFLPLSLDVGESLHEAVRLGGYLCLLVALSTLLSGGRGRRTLLAQIYGAAALVAGLGFLCGLGLAALPAPIGVPGGGATRALFPAALFNSNHLAALMGLGGLLLLDAAQAAKRDEPADPAAQLRRVGLYALCALCDVVLVGTLSRAGITVWLSAQALWLLWQVRRRDRLTRFGGLMLIGLLALMSLWPAAWTALRARFAAATLPELTGAGGKIHAWVEAWPLLRGHLAFGIGRGAFENAFQHVQGLSGRLRFVYLENEWLQVVVDWGVPVALALFGLLFLGLRDAWRRSTETAAADEQDTSRVALLALGALGVHNLFDFNLEVGGIAFAAIGLCAVAQRSRFAVSRFSAVALGIVTLAGAGVVAARFPSLDQDGARLRALCERPGAEVDEVLSAARAATLRHPFDAYLPALTAARLTAAPQEAQRALAVSWVNRALLANPHELLARQTAAALLIENGQREQALLLLRDAIADSDAQLRRQLLRSLRDSSTDPAELAATLPDTPSTDEFLELLGGSSTPRWTLLRALCQRLLAENRSPMNAALWLGRAALALHDAMAGEQAARALLQDPAYVPALLFADLGDLLGENSHAEAAVALLKQALLRGERPELLVALARQRERQGALDEARQLLEKALEKAESRELLARIHELYGDLEARAGNLNQATVHRMEAARLSNP